MTFGATAIGSLVLKGCASPSTDNQKADKDANSVPANNEGALYEAAKKEGKLVYYTVFFNQDVVNEIVAAFTKKYPGVQVQATRTVASAIFQQLNQELLSGVKNCDVFCTSDFSQMIQLGEQGKLLPYEPVGKENLLADFRKLNPDNLYHTGALVPVVIGYNTQKLNSAATPKGWKDLLNPNFQDKISTGSAAASGQVGVWALAMQQKFGWDNYFPQFNQLNPKLGRSINDPVADLVSGERAVGITTLGQLLSAKAKGNPVDVIYPAEGTVVVVGPVGILKDAPHPNAAKLFLSFLLSKEYSEVIAKYFEQPLHSDVAVAGAKPMKEMNPITPTPDQIKADILQVKRKWRDMFGA